MKEKLHIYGKCVLDYYKKCDELTIELIKRKNDKLKNTEKESVDMLEKRCPNCNHLFFKVENPMQWAKSLRIEIKCSKCKVVCDVTHHDGSIYTIPTIVKEVP